MSAKNRDNKSRFRSKTVGFRVSPEEWEQFEIAVKLSGLTKQDYLSNRIAQRDIVVQGNPRVYKALRDQLSDVLVELKRIDGLDKDRINMDLMEVIRCISFTLDGLSQDYNKKSSYPAR